jgi:hypothetical protein
MIGSGYARLAHPPTKAVSSGINFTLIETLFWAESVTERTRPLRSASCELHRVLLAGCWQKDIAKEEPPRG